MQTRRLHTTSSYLVGANGRIHFGSPAASSDRCDSPSPDHHTPGHLRVQRAEVLVGAWRIEREGELLVGIEYRRFEFFVAAHDHVGDIVAIRPPVADYSVGSKKDVPSKGIARERPSLVGSKRRAH